MKYNLQALRAYAAYSVVVHHIFNSVQNYLAVGLLKHEVMVGSTGVHVFFVISGYVITLTTREKMSVANFFYLRFTRVVPVYWLLTAIAALMLSCGFKIFGLNGLTPQNVIASFSFLPEIESALPAKLPILYVGWTLDYEIFFYLLFGICLVWRRNIDAAVVALIIVALWSYAKFSDNLYIQFYGADLILCFALGIGIYFADRIFSLPNRLCFAGLIIGFLGLFAIEIDNLAFKSLIVVGASALMVFSALQLEDNGRSVGRGFISRQGDASYSLYLLHPFVLQAIGKFSFVSGLSKSTVGLGVTVVIMLVASGAVAYLFHRGVERRIIQAFRRQDRLASAKLPGGSGRSAAVMTSPPARES